MFVNGIVCMNNKYKHRELSGICACSFSVHYLSTYRHTQNRKRLCFAILPTIQQILCCL